MSVRLNSKFNLLAQADSFSLFQSLDKEVPAERVVKVDEMDASNHGRRLWMSLAVLDLVGLGAFTDGGVGRADPLEHPPR